MMFSTVLAYFQLGQFLTLVMAVSWVYATFFFMSLCYCAGPVGWFGYIASKNCLSCRVMSYSLFFFICSLIINGRPLKLSKNLSRFSLFFIGLYLQ